jgi:DNA-binding HxlR family transcriptional regulator
MARAYNQGCPVAKSLEIVGDRWTLLIVRDLLPGPRRFADLLESLPGVSPAVLSGRLRRLEAHGIIARTLYSERPRRASYALTPKGRELERVTGALAVWGARHTDAAIQLTHAACGHPVRVRYHCPACDAAVPGSGVTLAARPARTVDDAVPFRPSRAAVARVTRHNPEA